MKSAAHSRSIRRRAGLAATVALVATSISLGPISAASADGQTVSAWLTTSNLSSALTAQTALSFANDSGTTPLTIDVDDQRAYQSITGFGATITDSSAWLMHTKQSSTQRSTLMSNLFGSSGIGLNILRQPMGSTDFIHTVGGYYTYDDTAADTSLSHFSISHDEADIIPMIQQALGVNPAIKVNLTSWSAPAWMKTNDSLMAPAQDGDPGTLLSADYGLYADYLVKAYQAYQADGIPISATSAQNEPTTGNTYNTMEFTPAQEQNFITNYLAPKLYAAGLQPRILTGDTVDFNSSYAPAVWDTAAGSAETDGASEHGYFGDPSAMTTQHDEFPYKTTYQSELAPYCTDTDFRDVLINGARNWAQTLVSWNVALDEDQGPYHTGATAICEGSPTSDHPGIPIQPLVTIDQSTGNVTYEPSYYWTGQFSKFVQPGAQRIASNSFGDSSIQDVAFLNPDGTRVVVAWNSDTSSGSGSTTFKVRDGSQSFTYSLAKEAMVTFKWSGGTSGSANGWGDSEAGTDNSTIYAGGLKTGTWTTPSTASANTTSLGTGWNSIYTGSDTRLSDYQASVTVRRTATGTTVSSPKYGIYACYRDSNNYVQAWIDPTNNQFISNVRLGGTDYGFSSAMALPSGFDPSVNHTIGVNKVGDTFNFTLDGVTQPSRPAPVPLGCQIGLVTEDTAAAFTNVTVLDRNAWGNSLGGTNAGNIYGGGLQAGSWIENDPTSLESTSLGAGWNSIYGKAGLASSNYTVSASARLVSTGTTSAHPKYGIYACYVNENNYVQEWIDSTNDQFVSHVILGGVDEGWTTSTLPALFDTSIGHVLSATKSGSSYTLNLDGVAQPSRTGPTTGCQIGAVTEDAAANYRSISAG
jgi:glucosylceramidase